MENSAQSARLPHLHESELFHAIKNPAFRRIGLMGHSSRPANIALVLAALEAVIRG